MSAGAVFDADVRLDEAARLTLRLSARYDHDSHGVWQALTTDDALSAWAPWQATIDPVAGGVVSVTFADGHAAEGEVIDAERPRRLVLRLPEDWGGNDEMLRWELQPTEHGCVVVFDVTIDDAELVNRAAAVWDISMQHLATLLAGGPVLRTDSPSADPRFESLVEEYEDLLGADVRALTQ